MLLLYFVEATCTKQGKNPDEACLSWSQDGKALIIKDQDELMRSVIPHVLHSKGSFTSFTRKLYRWGFRQKDVKCSRGRLASAATVKIFFHQFFQRGDKALMSKMRSTTAERTNSTNFVESKLTLERRLGAPTVICTGTSSIAQHQDALVKRLIERPLSMEYLHQQLLDAASLTNVRLSSFNPILPGHNHHFFEPTFQPLRSPASTFGMESIPFQRAVTLYLSRNRANALELKQKQAEIVTSALEDLARFVEQTKLFLNFHSD